MFLRPACLLLALVSPGLLAAVEVPATGVATAGTGTDAAARAKAAVLELAGERLRLAQAAGLDTAAEAADLAAGQGLDAAAMATPVTDVPHLPLFQPVPVIAGNPHVAALVARVQAELAKPDGAWGRGTRDHTPFIELGSTFGTRTNGARIRDYLWCYAYPESPLRGNPEVLIRLLRRAHAFVDAYTLYEDPSTTAKPDLYDQFTLESAIAGLREIRSAYPGLLLLGQRAAWDAAFPRIAERLWKMMAKANAWNLNIETARMVAVFHLGQLTGNQEMVDKVQRHLDLVLPKMFADGGWPYNGGSNPSVNYHDELTYSLVRLYDLTGYEPIAEALKASQWKGPVMGRTDEFWTSPFHKTYRWNFERGTECGPEAVVALSGNGYTRGLRDINKEFGARDDLAWFRSDVKAIPLPDRYTIPDRNVQGPRAWYGRFTYAATTRSQPSKEVGHETLLGAMTVDPDGRLNSVLTAVTPRVRILDADIPDGKGGVEAGAWGKLTAELVGAYVTGRNCSAASAVHAITAVRKNAYHGKKTGWTGRQVWLGLPDRVIGLVSTVPAADAAPEAIAVETVLRWISAGAAGAAVPKVLKADGAHRWRYGELVLVVHAGNAAAVDLREVPYRNPKFPAHELAFRLESAAPSAAAKVFPATSRLDVVVEIRPEWTTGEAKVHAEATGQVLALDATVAGKRYQVRFNPGNLPVDVPFAGLDAAHVSLRLTGEDPAPVRTVPATVSLLGGQQALVVESADETDHLPGWNSFAAMVAAPAP